MHKHIKKRNKERPDVVYMLFAARKQTKLAQSRDANSFKGKQTDKTPQL